MDFWISGLGWKVGVGLGVDWSAAATPMGGLPSGLVAPQGRRRRMKSAGGVDENCEQETSTSLMPYWPVGFQPLPGHLPEITPEVLEISQIKNDKFYKHYLTYL